MFPNTNNVTFQKQNKTKTTPFSPPPQTKPLNQRDLHKECKMFPSAVAAYVSVYGWSILNLQPLEKKKTSRTPKLRNVDKRLAEPLESSHGPSLQTRVLKTHFFYSLSLQNTAFSQNNSILKAPTREETLIYFANKRSSLCFTVFFSTPFPPLYTHKKFSFLFIKSNKYNSSHRMYRRTEFKNVHESLLLTVKYYLCQAFWYPAFCFIYKPWSWSFPALTYWPTGELASDNSPVSTPAWASVNLRRQWKAMVHSFYFYNLSLMPLKKHYYTQIYLEVLEPVTQVKEGRAGI